MKGKMSQEQFESLSRKLVNVMEKVVDKERLTRVACALIKADAAVLIKRSNKEREILEYSLVYPNEYGDWKASKTKEIYAWYKDAEVVGEEGFINEAVINVDGNKFEESLVSFGKRLEIFNFRYELVLLRRKKSEDFPFCSYTTWAVSKLIKALGTYEMEQELLRIEMDNERCLKYMSQNVFNDLKWKDLWEKMPSAKSASDIQEEEKAEITTFLLNCSLKMYSDYSSADRSNKTDDHVPVDYYDGITKLEGALKNTIKSNIFSMFSKHIQGVSADGEFTE